MTHLSEAFGQYVQQITPDELLRGNGGHTVAAGEKRDAVVADVDEPLVRDSDAVGIAAEVAEDLFGAAKWLFGVDDPTLLIQCGKHPGEGLRAGESCCFAVETELAVCSKPRKASQKDASEERAMTWTENRKRPFV